MTAKPSGSFSHRSFSSGLDYIVFTGCHATCYFTQGDIFNTPRPLRAGNIALAQLHIRRLGHHYFSALQTPLLEVSDGKLSQWQKGALLTQESGLDVGLGSSCHLSRSCDIAGTSWEVFPSMCIHITSFQGPARTPNLSCYPTSKWPKCRHWRVISLGIFWVLPPLK